MNFRKRLFGYKKEEVNNYINQIENKYDNEKKEILSKIQNLNLEYNNLSEKNLLLSRNLRSIKENTAFIENNNAYFDKVVKNAKSEAIEQLESIKRSQKITFEKIIKAASKLDELSDLLHQDLSEINLNLENIVSKIEIRKDIDGYLSKVDEIIGDSSGKDKEFDSYIAQLKNLEEKISNNDLQEKPKLSLIKNKQSEKVSLLRKMDVKRYLSNDDNETQNNAIEKATESRSYKSVTKAANLNLDSERPKTALLGIRDDDTLDLLKLILDRDGYDISYTQDGNEILKMVDNVESFGVLVLDSMIPYIDVGSLIKQIRKSESWCDTPVLIISSETRSESSVKYLANGANDYISTPFNPKELLARVNRLNKYPPYACMTEIL